MFKGQPLILKVSEIISAHDVSIQAQVINRMRKLLKERGLTYMFIAHELSMVRDISDRLAVMHEGHIVEMGTVEDIYKTPCIPIHALCFQLSRIQIPTRSMTKLAFCISKVVSITISARSVNSPTPTPS